MKTAVHFIRLRNSKILLATLASGIVILAGLLLYAVVKPGTTEQNSTEHGSVAYKQILITSVPENTEITLEKPCADGKFKIKTPYVCKLVYKPAKITAPETHTGADYVFKGWEGCLVDKNDPLSCTPNTTSAKNLQMRAIYQKKPRVVVIQATPTSAPANPCDSFSLDAGGVTCTLNLSKYKDRQELILEYKMDSPAYRSITYISVYCTKQPQNDTCPGLESYPNNLQTSISLSQFDKDNNSLVIYSERRLTSLDCDFDYDPVTNYMMPDCPKRQFDFKSIEGTGINANTYKITLNYTQN